MQTRIVSKYLIKTIYLVCTAISNLVLTYNFDQIDEGNKIEFQVESSGEVKTGRLTGISGKGDKTKITIMSEGGEHEEIWSLICISEGSLKVVSI